MRSVFARLALAGVFGFAPAGCGGSDALAPGAVPNNAGGGSVPVSSQNAPGIDVPSVLIDGGVVSATNTYRGANVTASDAQSTVDAGTDPKSGGSGTAPVDPAGSHEITFAGNGSAQIVLAHVGAVPALSYSGTAAGQLIPADYGAVVLYAGITASLPPPAASAPRVAIELVGATGLLGTANPASTYDVRSVCGNEAVTGATPQPPLVRFVCALPAYGAIAGTAGSVTIAAASVNAQTGTVTPAVTSQYQVDANFANPVIGGATGSFTPAAPTLYVELIYPQSTATASTGNVLALDYIYAESGTK